MTLTPEEKEFKYQCHVCGYWQYYYDNDIICLTAKDGSDVWICGDPRVSPFGTGSECERKYRGVGVTKKRRSSLMADSDRTAILKHGCEIVEELTGHPCCSHTDIVAEAILEEREACSELMKNSGRADLAALIRARSDNG